MHDLSQSNPVREEGRDPASDHMLVGVREDQVQLVQIKPSQKYITKNTLATRDYSNPQKEPQ